ncbi:hypothetical protein IEN85_23340 [Pelagicoccus sp. NFK12]|uniref:Uncharacterized protein n=1 Tax=Pelagicoccus enzymogenes TaxID=2773457 RepID=A0A927FCF2_9BACT|nr:hypothetical protein [Pelagicoccus enzymogenes]MBD5782452.1 hypothetical protein [Pelagicoccus enzymogenes]
MRTPLALNIALFSLLAATSTLVSASTEMKETTGAVLKRLDAYWDARAGFLWSPSSPVDAHTHHNVRSTGWYAVALLERDGPGDRERAAQALRSILTQQIDAPGEPWHATFYRSPEEPHIPLFPELWRDYDINWRQFVGVAFALCIIEFEDKLPADLTPKLLASIELALEGEIASGRLRPDYTNIALMQAFLLDFVGHRLDRPDWREKATEWAVAVAEAYDEHSAFEEFNSPTYYGVDFMGLTLWRKYARDSQIREIGARLEAELWRDTAEFYHAGMRNLCGPYDRSYGMDMTHYASLLGLWLRLDLPAEIAPFPPVDDPNMGHAHDFNYAPLFAIIGTEIPEDVVDALSSFSGPRFVERELPRGRTATAWLDHDVMLGGTETGFGRGAGGKHNQLHPATIHWIQSDGSIGWILLTSAPRLDARASKRRLEIKAIGDLTFTIHSSDGASFEENAWQLPGLQLEVEHDALEWETSQSEDGKTSVTFFDATHIVITAAQP